MNIFPTVDESIIKPVVFHPDILPHISEDDAIPEGLPDALYLAGEEAGNVVGILMCFPISAHVFDVHIHVLPEYRKEYAKEFFDSAADWIWHNTHCLKMTAQIPFCCDNVKKFAIRCGFEIEGINKNSWMKNGVLHDSYYLGLERSTQWDG